MRRRLSFDSFVEAVRKLIHKLIIPYAVFALLFLGYYFFQYEFKFFAFIGLLVGLACFLLALTLLAYSRNKAQVIWACFNIAVSIWSLACFFVGHNDQIGINVAYGWRMHNSGLILIPVFLYHFVIEYTNAKKTDALFLVYLQASIFLWINLFTKLLVKDFTFYYGEFYYLQATPAFTVFLIIFTGISITAFIRFYKFYSAATGLKRIQSAYLLYGMLLGFVGGFTLAPLAYGLNLYPAGLFGVGLYAGIATYAICRYKLIDIKLAVTRTGIFVAVYSIVLGIPFVLAFGLRERLIVLVGESWWLVPLIFLTFLATGGPFIYLYIQRRAEDRLLKEQRRYQSTLRQASAGMNKIKDLRRLVNLIVHIVTRTVGIEHSCVYLWNAAEKTFYLAGSRFNRNKLPLPPRVDMNDTLIDFLVRIEEPVVLEEISQRVRDYHDEELVKVEHTLRQILAEVAVPSFVEERLLGILVLGKKASGELYSQDDLAVFSILANQAALAIENAQFYEDMKKTHAQLLKTEKMATIGTMADGLSHQINNRLHAMGFIAGDLLDTVQLKKDTGPPPEISGVLAELEEGLGKIIDNVKRGGEIVEGLLKYTRKGDEGFENIELDKLINASLDMVQFKIKLGEIAFVRDYPKDLPLMKGNFTQLQEVLFNAIDNAYDAMMQRKAEENSDTYKPQLRVTAERDGLYLNVTVLDNGIGVKDDDQEKLFTPFFTTKFAASKKGTGLGLYVIKKLIEDNHKGKLRFESEYMKGTTFRLWLPLA